ncbi:MAG TPA: Rid family detoxifying hydrolase [Nevskiaceae bacterium]|nr:Rid family detoxifying hydrolase [Nevskiaceae bacterium]
MNNQKDKPSTFGPYSPVRQAGTLYFISGQVGVDVATKTAPHGVADQTRLALANLAGALDSVGLTPDDVLKTTVYLADMGDFAAMNDIYVQFFVEPRPARACVAVKELPRVAGDIPIRVEIEAVAAKD